MRVFKTIITSFSVFVIAACCGVVLLTHWSAFGIKFLAVPTGSMRPDMPPGSFALMHRVPDSSLRVGDIITYVNPLNAKLTVSHRIIKEEQTKNNMPIFITKGDANPTPDVPVMAGQVLGKVIWHKNDLGFIILWSKTLLGIALLIYIPAMLIVAEEIQRLNEYFKISQPYKLIGYRGYKIIKKASGLTPKIGLGLSAFAFLMFEVGLIGPKVEAMLVSNTVTLSNNILIIKSTGHQKHQCTGNTNNNTTVNVNNSSSQSGTSGNASVTGNTSGGNATSGSVTNNNTSTTTITIINC